MSADIDHIAIKVADIDQFSKGLQALGYSVQSSGQYDEVGMRIAFLGAGPSEAGASEEKKGDSPADRVELLEVIDPSSPIAADPEGLHHLAISVTDIEQRYQEMKDSLLYNVEGTIRQGAHSRIFFFRMAGTEQPLFECCEKPAE